MDSRLWIGAALLGVLSLPLHGATAASTVVPSSEVARTIDIDNLTVHEGSVSGRLVNKSPARVRGVDLLLRQVWHWKDEFHPGTDSPGRTLPLTWSGDIAPNASAPFTFEIPPLSARSDGYFDTTMEVTGFTEVGP